MHNPSNPEELLEFLRVNIRRSSVEVRSDVDINYEFKDSIEEPEKFLSQSYSAISHVIATREYNEYDEPVDSASRIAFQYSVGFRTIFSDELEDVDRADFESLLEVKVLFDVIFMSDQHIDFSAYTKDSGSLPNVERLVVDTVWPYWIEYVQSTCSRIGLTHTISIEKPKETTFNAAKKVPIEQ